MNVLWIIGSGFDLNLGLKTGYSDFNKYRYQQLNDKQAVAQRAKLENAAESLPGSRKLWSDLEVFLGASTAFFKTPDEHHECFLRMKQEMESYLLEQQGRFDAAEQTSMFFQELADSLAKFLDRLDTSERTAIEDKFDKAWIERLDIVTLNYTNCIEECISRMDNRAPNQNGLGSRYPIIDSLVHAHGSLEEPRQIVFAIANVEQAANQVFRINDEFRQCWTKPGLDDVYGNDRLHDAFEAISRADVIASFGCSFGPTDEHIWLAIGERMRAANDAYFVSFYRSLPEKGVDTREYLRQSRVLKKQLADTLRLDDDANSLNRIVPIPSSRVFRFDGERRANLSRDPNEDVVAPQKFKLEFQPARA